MRVLANGPATGASIASVMRLFNSELLARSETLVEQEISRCIKFSSRVFDPCLAARGERWLNERENWIWPKRLSVSSGVKPS
jgi:hypothetical protein